ncbi:MAG: Lytic transglycosylase, catalytic [Ramlibacter sp.]|jgi:soluble lytic murein transglycosylase-like protein|nr:Lytic transglycosylase, catalytic [Ramlibacter sp.]
MKNITTLRDRKLMGQPSALFLTAAAMALTPGGSYASEKESSPAPFTSSAERCLIPAAEYHSVNPYVRRAILKVESNLNPAAIGRNANGTVDVGIGQHSSMHFKELAKHGIEPAHLLDACVGTYVAAWHLRRVVERHGNTWEGVARYHSATPYFNKRYQILLTNEPVRSKVLQGPLQRVPSINPSTSPAEELAARSE